MSVNVSMEKRRASARLLLVFALILFTTPRTSGQSATGDLPGPERETSDPSAAADRFLGPEGEPVRVQVVGCRTYKAEDILHKLSRAYRFLLVAHPGASPAAYIAFVESSIELGYRHGGFPEAQVSAFHDKQREVVFIKIDEGGRLMAGSVVVEGNQSVPAEAFIKELTERREEKKLTNKQGVPMEMVEIISAVWEPGTPARLDFVALRQAAHRARGVYLRAGFISPEVEASWRRGDN